MLLRISLILSILAGIGAIVVSQLMVKEHIQGIITVRDENIEGRAREKARAEKAETNLKATSAKLAGTEKKLATTEEQLAATTAAKTAAEGRATTLATELEKTKTQLSDTQQKLAAWAVLGINVEQVKQIIADRKALADEREILTNENRILSLNNKKLQAKLDILLKPGDEEHPVEMTAGLKGRIVVVDPKWDFVVLNIGTNQGALEDGIMLVNRDGKLIAKVKIRSVQSDRCIANILPGWRLEDVKEGDQVFY